MGSLFAFRGRQMGRLPNDHQSQRALGVDFSDGALRVFRRAIAGGAERDTAAASSNSEKTTGAPVALNKYAKPRHSKKHSQRKSDKTALKSSAAKKASFVADAAGTGSTAIPPSVANANAQLASAEPPPGSARAMSAKASTMLLAAADKQADTQSVAETQVVAADQLNDLDRALQESKSAAPTTAPTLAMASAEPRTAPVAASSREDPPGTRPR